MLSVLVQRTKRLNISKEDRSFKIHIDFMTKDAAAAVREALSAELNAYQCLSSSEKEDTMLA